MVSPTCPGHAAGPGGEEISAKKKFHSIFAKKEKKNKRARIPLSALRHSVASSKWEPQGPPRIPRSISQAWELQWSPAAAGTRCN